MHGSEGSRHGIVRSLTATAQATAQRNLEFGQCGEAHALIAPANCGVVGQRHMAHPPRRLIVEPRNRTMPWGAHGLLL